MESNKLISLIIFCLLSTFTAQSQEILRKEDENKEKPAYRHMIGMHLSACSVLGGFNSDIRVPMASISEERFSISEIKAIGLNYFYQHSDNFSYGIRFSTHKFNTGSGGFNTPINAKIGLHAANVYESLLCIRIKLIEGVVSLPLEFSGGPLLSEKMILNPRYIDYSSPYQTHIWFRGLITNMKMGLEFKDSSKRFQTQLGLQTGTYGMNAYRLEIDGPVEQPEYYRTSYSGIHIGGFIEMSYLFH
jgi:hypothetical protein